MAVAVVEFDSSVQLLFALNNCFSSTRDPARRRNSRQRRAFSDIRNIKNMRFFKDQPALRAFTTGTPSGKIAMFVWSARMETLATVEFI
jgi:hypothetical protein